MPVDSIVTNLSHVASIIIVLSVLSIFIMNILLYSHIKALPFLLYSFAWFLAFVVRLWIMLVELWPATFFFDVIYYYHNIAFSIVYIVLVIGTGLKIRTILDIIKHGVNSVLRSGGK